MSRMQARRESAGLSLAHVADQLHRSTEAVRRWERGQNMPSRHCLVVMAQMYGCAAQELID